MSETKHSPLPWIADPDDRPGYDWNIHILDAKGNRVCFMTSDGPSEENAAFIVLATSLHHELVSALEMFVQRIERHGNWDDGCFYYGNTSASELQDPLTIASSLLKKAKQPNLEEPRG